MFFDAVIQLVVDAMLIKQYSDFLKKRTGQFGCYWTISHEERQCCPQYRLLWVYTRAFCTGLTFHTGDLTLYFTSIHQKSEWLTILWKPNNTKFCVKYLNKLICFNGNCILLLSNMICCVFCFLVLKFVRHVSMYNEIWSEILNFIKLL